MVRLSLYCLLFHSLVQKSAVCYSRSHWCPVPCVCCTESIVKNVVYCMHVYCMLHWTLCLNCVMCCPVGKHTACWIESFAGILYAVLYCMQALT